MNYFVHELNAKGIPLNHLLEWCLEKEKVDSVMLGIVLEKKGRKLAYDKQAASAVERILRGKYLAYQVSDHWPGTECKGSPNLVIIGRFDAEVLGRIVATANYLGAWQGHSVPPLPEDICVFRTGQRIPTLFSASHENLLWLASATVPPFRFTRKFSDAENVLANKLDIPGGRYFCEPYPVKRMELILPSFCRKGSLTTLGKVLA